MKNPGRALRDIYTAALASLTYEGQAVKVYDNVPVETTPDKYVYVNAIDYDQVGNNQLFVHTGSVAIDVVVKQYKKVDTDVLDEIAQTACNLILANSSSQLSNADYNVMNPQVESATYLFETDGAYHISRKIIRFTQTLIQV